MAEGSGTPSRPGRRVSIVVPALNEEESIGPLYEELTEMSQAHHLDLEILFVDDGSGDGTWDVIRRLASGDSRVRGIRFRRNFGKAAALGAAFKRATGDTIVTLDADLQDDPAEVPRMLERLDSGLDAVTGWKRRRYDPWHKVWPSRLFNLVVSRVTKVHLHDHNCGFKAYRSEVVKELRLYGELHRFIPVLAHSRGFRVGELEINHRPRLHGRSKYGARRFVRGLLDLLTVTFLTGFGQRPLHLLGGVGLIAFLLGFVGMAYLAVERALGAHIGGRPLLTYSLMSLLLGTQLVALGIIAELLIAQGTREEERYSIAQTTDSPGH